MAQKETEKTYDESQIAERLQELPGWYYEDGWIRRVYKTDGWPTTLMLVNAIGFCSEAAYHHPDLAVTWGRIVVKLSTHSAGGITDKDFALARPQRPGGNRPRADSRVVRRRSPDHRRQGRRAGEEGTEGSARDSRLLRARGGARVRRMGHRDHCRNQQCAPAEPRVDSGRGRLFPLLGRRRDRRRLHAGPRVSCARRGGTRVDRSRDARQRRLI